YGQTLRAWAGRTAWIAWGGSDVALLGTLAALGCLLRWVVSVTFVNAEVSWQIWHIAEGALWAAIVTLVVVAPSRTKLLWSNRVWRTLGLLSYSVYMIHFPLMWY